MYTVRVSRLILLLMAGCPTQACPPTKPFNTTRARGNSSEVHMELEAIDMIVVRGADRQVDGPSWVVHIAGAGPAFSSVGISAAHIGSQWRLSHRSAKVCTFHPSCLTLFPCGKAAFKIHKARL